MKQASHLRGAVKMDRRVDCAHAKFGTSLCGELMPSSHRRKSAVARIHFSRPILPCLGLRTPSKWYPKGKSLEKPNMLRRTKLAAISVEGVDSVDFRQPGANNLRFLPGHKSSFQAASMLRTAVISAPTAIRNAFSSATRPERTGMADSQVRRTFEDRCRTSLFVRGESCD